MSARETRAAASNSGRSHTSRRVPTRELLMASGARSSPPRIGPIANRARHPFLGGARCLTVGRTAGEQIGSQVGLVYGFVIATGDPWLRRAPVSTVSGMDSVMATCSKCKAKQDASAEAKKVRDDLPQIPS